MSDQDFEQLRDRILRALYDHDLSGGSEMMDAQQIAIQLGEDAREIDDHMDLLQEQGYIRVERAFSGPGSAWLLPLGKQRVREGVRAHERTAASPSIGAIIHSMSGGTVQATGTAYDSNITQIVQSPDTLRESLQELIDRLVDIVKTDVSSSDLQAYVKAADTLQEQLLSGQPQPTAIRRALSTLALFGDVEGSIGLMTRVWPFVSPIVMLAGQVLGG